MSLPGPTRGYVGIDAGQLNGWKPAIGGLKLLNIFGQKIVWWAFIILVNRIIHPTHNWKIMLKDYDSPSSMYLKPDKWRHQITQTNLFV